MTKSWLELRVPPVALVVFAGLAMAGLAWAAPTWRVRLPHQGVWAAASALLGAVIALAGVWQFRQVHTTVNPTAPERSSSVVANGVYRFSRNPMYLGFLLILVGLGLYLGHLGAAIVIAGFVLYMNRFQITPEERTLEAKFGAAYAAYRARVRRWI